VPVNSRCRACLAEREAGTCDRATHEAFAARVHAWKGAFGGLLDRVAGDGGRIIGYGAAAKANTTLNFCPEAAARIEVILDKNPIPEPRVLAEWQAGRPPGRGSPLRHGPASSSRPRHQSTVFRSPSSSG